MTDPTRAGAVSRLSQQLSDRALSESMGAAVARKLRKVPAALGADPIVTVDIAGAQIRMPATHELPHYQKVHPRYSMNLADVAAAVATAGGTTMIDIGANVGDSVAIAKSGAPDLAILCIDGDPAYSTLLTENVAQWTDIWVETPVLLGAESKAIAGAVTRVGGTSRIDRDANESLELWRLDDLLVDHPTFAEPSLIKSDTDGFEGLILQGAAKTLEASAPTLFIEYDPKLLALAGSDGLELLGWLQSLGYGRAAFFDNFGDFLLEADLQNSRLLSDMHHYLLQESPPFRYFDVLLTTADSMVIDETVKRYRDAVAGSGS